MALEQLGGSGLHRRPTAEGDDPALLGERPGHLDPLQLPERRLAVLDEQVRDAPADVPDDRLVGVVERHAEQVGERAAGHGLARPGRPDDDGDRAVQPRSP